MTHSVLFRILTRLALFRSSTIEFDTMAIVSKFKKTTNYYLFYKRIHFYLSLLH